jgi:putative oxidoreductase
MERRIVTWVLAAVKWADRIPSWLLGLIIRVGIANGFWRSGQTKVSHWHVTPAAIQLFRDEYKLPLLPPELAANLAALQEHLFSFLLIIGLASRLSALGLLAMTGVIEVFVYPENWPDHLLWSGCLLYVIARGPGALSVDALIRRAFSSSDPHGTPVATADDPGRGALTPGTRPR